MGNLENLDLTSLDFSNIENINPFANDTNKEEDANTLFDDVAKSTTNTNKVEQIELKEEAIKSEKRVVKKIEEIKTGDTLKIDSLSPAIVLSLKDITNKLNLIEKDMNSIFVEREDIIKSIILAVVSKQHIILVGQPGTGKSFLIDNFTKRITGVSHFNWQLTRTTDPSELFGPISIKDMENDKFRRKIEGTLLDSHTAYLDEIFKANSAILNSLLQIMNERTFNNDGQRIKCPLLTIFASSNEWGEDESLEAFTDRFVFKHEVKYISNSKNLIKLLNNKANGVNNGYTEQLSLEEINFLHDEVKKVTINNITIKALADLLADLKVNGSVISDRKACQCLDIMKAHAVLNNRNIVTNADLQSLTYVLWDGKTDISEIKNLITGYVSPYIKKYNEFSKDYNSIVRKFFKTDTVAEHLQYVTDNMQSISSVVTLVSDVLNDIDEYDALHDNFKDMLATCTKFKDFLVNFISQPQALDSIKINDYLVKAI